jgi:CHAD domain-containing protein
MPYRLKPDQPLPDEVRRIVAGEIESATEALAAKRAKNRDEAIHEARKSVKKIRALLRLVRPGLGKWFRRENIRYRNIGQTLSQLRDAGAKIETFDSLKAKYKDQWSKHNLDSVRRALIRNKREAERALNMVEATAQVAEALRSAGKHVKSWPLDDDGFSAIAEGLERTFRDSRQAMKAALIHPAPDKLHEWRKRVKDHWYHVRLLEDLWTPVLREYEKSLKQLETWLGDDHNLVMLRDDIDRDPAAFGKDADVALFLALIDSYRKELRERAFELGKSVYDEKPKEYARRIKRIWKAEDASR